MNPRLLIFFWALLAACATIPPITPVENRRLDPITRECQAFFPDGNWQLVHAISFKAPGGNSGVLMGVTNVYPDQRRIECVLMTVEGFVLFEARKNGLTVVDRAVPPFDSESFSNSLLEDVWLLFIPPEAPPVALGKLDSGSFACRLSHDGNSTLDIITDRDGTKELHLYDSAHARIRTVTAEDFNPVAGAPGKQLPRRLILTAHGLAGYELSMRLIDATQLE